MNLSTDRNSLILLVALDNRTTSIRELLRQLRAKRFTTANPKLAINVDVHDRPQAPTANFEFVDGTQVRRFKSRTSSNGKITSHVRIYAIFTSNSMKQMTTMHPKSCFKFI